MPDGGRGSRQAGYGQEFEGGEGICSRVILRQPYCGGAQGRSWLLCVGCWGCGWQDLWRLDLSTNKWEHLDLKNGPTARSGHRMVSRPPSQSAPASAQAPCPATAGAIGTFEGSRTAADFAQDSVPGLGEPPGRTP